MYYINLYKDSLLRIVHVICKNSNNFDMRMFLP